MSQQPLEIAVGKPDRYGKRLVAVVNGSTQHRDTFDTDNAFARSKWREAVVDRFGLSEDGHAWLERQVLEKADAADDEAPTGQPVVESMADVEAGTVNWIWIDYLPQGALCLIDGDPGLGKSQATIWLAGAITNNSPMPDGSQSPLGRPRGVLLLSAEDDPSRTIRPRLDAVGADLSRVHLFAGVDTIDGDTRQFVLPDDAAALEIAIRDADAALVVIDPLVAYLASDVNMNSDADVRRALKPLSAIAERTGATILMLRHLNKKSGASSMYRGGGSVGIIAASRAAFVFAKSKDDAEVRILAPVKMNLAPMPPSLSFRVEQHESTSRIVWEGETDTTADDLLSGGEKRLGNQFETAQRIIAETLSDGPRGSNEVEQACTAEGISKRTYWRARKAVGVVPEKIEFNGEWMLSLPPETDQQPYEEFQ